MPVLNKVHLLAYLEVSKMELESLLSRAPQGHASFLQHLNRTGAFTNMPTSIDRSMVLPFSMRRKMLYQLPQGWIQVLVRWCDLRNPLNELLKDLKFYL